MSGQILELIIFAGIAVFVITKLISILGTTSEDEIGKKSRGGFFGEPLNPGTGNTSKEVSNTAVNISKEALKGRFTKMQTKLNGLIVNEHKDDIQNGLNDVMFRMPNFTLEKFLNNAKKAFLMIIESGNNQNIVEIEKLVDKRYVSSFSEMSQSYGKLQMSDLKLGAIVSEIYMFGNNAFIKVLFSGKNITDKVSNLNEEWTFSKSTIADDPVWYLTNIDRPQ